MAKKKTATKKPVAKKAAAKKTAAKKPAAKKTAAKKTAAKKTAAKKPASKTKLVIEVDSHCPIASKAKVHEDYNAMLNQTNIGANNNKFYVIQLLESGSQYHVWNRWGRVGEHGQNALKGPYTEDAAIKEFEAKFRSKTSNAWGDRANFTAKAGKYALIEVEASAEDEETEELNEKLKALDASRPAPVAPKYAQSKLDKAVQGFVDLIFNHDMFRDAMAALDIDVNKMPLGKLSKSQVAKGFEVLEALETALGKSQRSKLEELSSQFYTVIPHDFGRRRPTAIGTAEELQAKKDMLNVLSDIEMALGLQDSAKKKTSTAKLLPNPCDEHYAQLKADLEVVSRSSAEWDMIQTYIDATCGGRKPKLLDAFRVDRHGSATRFAAHDAIDNRRLLWHGTSVAVVAAILKSGLRIMPHSGGRVGKGIYLASEWSKSAGYVGTSGRTGIMFLVEGALGKEHSITRDDWRLKAAPKGHDSIVARGTTEPDPKADITWEFEGRTVTVPQGKPQRRKQYSNSSFSQSEYLVYKESQARLRYVLKLNM